MVTRGEFLLDLYRLTLHCQPRDFQSQVLALLRGRLAFDSGRWMMASFTDPVHVTWHQVHLENEPEDMLMAHCQVRSKDRMLLAALGQRRDNRPAFIYHSPTRYPVRSAPEMHDYQKRYGHQNVLNVFLKWHAGSETFYRMVALYRRDADAQFGMAELTSMREWLPHLLQAQAINRATQLASSAGPLRCARGGLGIAASDRSLQYLEPAARELMQREWPGFDSGRVPEMLWARLSAANAYRGANVVVHAQVVDGLLYFKIRPGCSADRLSLRELEVAKLACEGLTHKQIARRLILSPATARNHLQHVRAKLNVHKLQQIAMALDEL